MDSSSNSQFASAAGDIERIAFVSLGCPKNLVDSEKMLGLLAEDGLVPTADHDDADAIVVNTCGFLEAAKDESLEVIREAGERRRAGQIKRLVVAGCLVQRHRAKLLEWCPEIDALIGVYERDRIVSAVRGGNGNAVNPAGSVNPSASDDGPQYWIAKNAVAAANERGISTVGLTVDGQTGKGLGYFESDATRLRLTPRHYAYMRISEGCNQLCSFCTIPKIRGKMRSKSADAIRTELTELFADGAFEINLIGQDTTSYGDDIGYAAGLSGILTEMDREAQTNGGAWLRLMYAYPSCFTDEMIDTIASLPNMLKYIDMPLQHASDRMLDVMDRRITRGETEVLLNKLRERIPGIAIRTTFITGFPGETQDDHDELLEFIEEVGFDNLGVFEYSPEPTTPAYRMEQDPDLTVPAEVKKARYEEIMLAQQRLAFEQNKYLASLAHDDRGALNTDAAQFDVLIDKATNVEGNATTGVSEDESRLYTGRTYFQAPEIDAVTYVQSRNSRAPGELVRCVIVDSDGYDLIAQPIEELERSTSLPILR